MLRLVTDFADQSVLEPALVWLVLVLVWLRLPRAAAGWAVAVVASFGLIGAMKLLFAACGSPLPHHALVSPSGHTMAATVFYGGIAQMLVPSAGAAMAVALGVALLIGATRVLLHAHTVAEVLVGAAVGLTTVVVLRRMTNTARAVFAARDRRWRTGLLMVLLLPCLLLHGSRSHAEGWLQIMGWRYVRAALQCSEDFNE